ncbi:hypothetical protein K504DRAFT_495196 [Pleomassaria siparia CBS 279.74]|uniref:ATP synthase subunit delta, mitochondrial n=1 Tax=Pleomassaria siparia CBS 279.74 TaxID=1314801 RepID=A0A6G1JTR0_9PLEO|nr:hypothetical protein K504DRAFT_495196 [Pleomassaria siparia CBS 279.74]
MSSLRIARAALRVKPSAIARPLQRRGYADVAPDKIKLSLALPHQAIYKSQDVVQVNIPAETGEMGVLANHVPSIEQLKPGLVEIIEEAGGSKQFFLSGGFAVVQPGSQLSINAVEGYALEDFSAEAVRSQIAEAQKVASGSGSEQDIAEAKIELELPVASAPRSNSAEIREPSQPLPTAARRKSSSRSNSTPPDPSESRTSNPGLKLAAYLQGKNPYGEILSKVEHPYKKTNPAAGPPSQLGSSIEGRPRTSGSLRFATRPMQPEPQRASAAPATQPPLVSSKPGPKQVSVRASKNFFESKASEGGRAPPWPPSTSLATTKSAAANPEIKDQQPQTTTQQRSKEEAARPTRIPSPSNEHVATRKYSDPALPIPRRPSETSKRVDVAQRTNPFTRQKLKPVVRTANAPRSADGRVSLNEAVKDQRPASTTSASLEEGIASRGRSMNVFDGSKRSVKPLVYERRAVDDIPQDFVRRQSTRKPLTAAETGEIVASDSPKRAQKSQRPNPDRDVRRASTRRQETIANSGFISTQHPDPKRTGRQFLRKGSRSVPLVQNEFGDDFAQRRRWQSTKSATKVTDRDIETFVQNFGDPIKNSKNMDDIVSKNLNHDGSGSNDSFSRRTSVSDIVPMSNIEEAYYDTHVPYLVDSRAGYGRRKTQDFGFPGARIRPHGTFRTYNPLQDPGTWIKRSCGHFSNISATELREEASRMPCRQCLIAHPAPDTAQNYHVRRRASTDSSVASVSSSKKDHGSYHTSRRRQHHSECVPADKCGDMFAKDLGNIIDAILEEHANTLDHVISNIRSSQPTLSHLRRVSEDLIHRCQAGGKCTKSCHKECSSHSSPCTHQQACKSDCQPIYQHVCRPVCQSTCQQVCQPPSQQVREWVPPPCPYVPPNAAQKLNVGKPGQLGPNLNDSRESLGQITKSFRELIDLVNSAADDLGVDLDERPTIQEEESFISAPFEAHSRQSIVSHQSIPLETVEEERQVPSEDSWLQETRTQFTKLSEARSQLMDELNMIARDIDVQTPTRTPVSKALSQHTPVSTNVEHVERRLSHDKIDTSAASEPVQRIISSEVNLLQRLLSKVYTILSRQSTRLRNKSIDAVTEELPKIFNEEISERRLIRVLTHILTQSRRVSAISQGLRDDESIRPETIQQWLEVAQTELPAAIDAITTVMDALPTMGPNTPIDDSEFEYEQEPESAYEEEPEPETEFQPQPTSLSSSSTRQISRQPIRRPTEVQEITTPLSREPTGGKTDLDESGILERRATRQPTVIGKGPTKAPTTIPREPTQIQEPKIIQRDIVREPTTREKEPSPERFDTAATQRITARRPTRRSREPSVVKDEQPPPPGHVSTRQSTLVECPPTPTPPKTDAEQALEGTFPTPADQPESEPFSDSEKSSTYSEHSFEAVIRKQATITVKPESPELSRIRSFEPPVIRVGMPPSRQETHFEVLKSMEDLPSTESEDEAIKIESVNVADLPLARHCSNPPVDLDIAEVLEGDSPLSTLSQASSTWSTRAVKNEQFTNEEEPGLVEDAMPEFSRQASVTSRKPTIVSRRATVVSRQATILDKTLSPEPPEEEPSWSRPISRQPTQLVKQRTERLSEELLPSPESTTMGLRKLTFFDPYEQQPSPPTQVPIEPVAPLPEQVAQASRQTTWIYRLPTRVSTIAPLVIIQRDVEPEPESQRLSVLDGPLASLDVYNATAEPSFNILGEEPLPEKSVAEDEQMLQTTVQRVTERRLTRLPTEHPSRDSGFFGPRKIVTVPSYPQARRRKPSSAPGVVAPVRTLEAETKQPSPSHKRRKVPVVPLDQQYPRAPTYPVWNVPAWIKPDVRESPLKSNAEPAPKEKRKTRSIWSSKSKEEPRPAPPKSNSQIRPPEPFRDKQGLGSVPGGTQQRSRSHRTQPGYEPNYPTFLSGRDPAPVPARRDGYYAHAASASARKDDHHPRLPPPIPVRRGDYPEQNLNSQKKAPSRLRPPSLARITAEDEEPVRSDQSQQKTKGRPVRRDVHSTLRTEASPTRELDRGRPKNRQTSQSTNRRESRAEGKQDGSRRASKAAQASAPRPESEAPKPVRRASTRGQQGGTELKTEESTKEVHRDIDIEADSQHERDDHRRRNINGPSSEGGRPTIETLVRYTTTTNQTGFSRAGIRPLTNHVQDPTALRSTALVRGGVTQGEGTHPARASTRQDLTRRTTTAGDDYQKLPAAESTTSRRPFIALRRTGRRSSTQRTPTGPPLPLRTLTAPTRVPTINSQASDSERQVSAAKDRQASGDAGPGLREGEAPSRTGTARPELRATTEILRRKNSEPAYRHTTTSAANPVPAPDIGRPRQASLNRISQQTEFSMHRPSQNTRRAPNSTAQLGSGPTGFAKKVSFFALPIQPPSPTKRRKSWSWVRKAEGGGSPVADQKVAGIVATSDTWKATETGGVELGVGGKGDKGDMGESGEGEAQGKLVAKGLQVSNILNGRWGWGGWKGRMSV